MKVTRGVFMPLYSKRKEEIEFTAEARQKFGCRAKAKPNIMK